MKHLETGATVISELRSDLTQGVSGFCWRCVDSSSVCEEKEEKHNKHEYIDHFHLTLKGKKKCALSLTIWTGCLHGLVTADCRFEYAAKPTSLQEMRLVIYRLCILN